MSCSWGGGGGRVKSEALYLGGVMTVNRFKLWIEATEKKY